MSRSRTIGAIAGSILLSIALLVASCSQTEVGTPTALPQPSQMGEVTVFAASSLTGAFGQVKSELEERGDGKITYNFAGSQSLVTQLSQGARADVFAPADIRNMDAALAAGVVEPGTQRMLTTNRLVVAVELGGKIDSLEDLSQPGVKLVLAAESVPAGNYALQVLDKLSADPRYGTTFKNKVLANVVSREENVRQVVAKVELGEADAGFVYATDVRSSQVGTVEIPQAYNVVASYMIAPLKDSPNPQSARQFIDFILSAQGQDILEELGFGGSE
jgi:molybdate transport system substrate-binding protein